MSTKLLVGVHVVFILKSILSFCKCVFVCVQGGEGAHEYRDLQRPEEGARFSGSGLTGSGEQPQLIGGRNQTQILC